MAATTVPTSSTSANPDANSSTEAASVHRWTPRRDPRLMLVNVTNRFKLFFFFLLLLLCFCFAGFCLLSQAMGYPGYAVVS